MEDTADFTVYAPHGTNTHAVAEVIPLQLIGYYIRWREARRDKPRNLAKSVTVEQTGRQSEVRRYVRH